LLRLRVLSLRLLPRFLAVARDLVRVELLRADADLRLERERAEALRVDVLRERVEDFLLAFFLPRPVDFFVAAIVILSLSLHRAHFHNGVLNVNQSNCVGLCVNGVHSNSSAAGVIMKNKCQPLEPVAGGSDCSSVITV
jgi:hypothetical protein